MTPKGATWTFCDVPQTPPKGAFCCDDTKGKKNEGPSEIVTGMPLKRAVMIGRPSLIVIMTMGMVDDSIPGGMQPDVKFELMMMTAMAPAAIALFSFSWNEQMPLCMTAMLPFRFVVRGAHAINGLASLATAETSFVFTGYTELSHNFMVETRPLIEALTYGMHGLPSSQLHDEELLPK